MTEKFGVGLTKVYACIYIQCAPSRRVARVRRRYRSLTSTGSGVVGVQIEQAPQVVGRRALEVPCVGRKCPDYISK